MSICKILSSRRSLLKLAWTVLLTVWIWGPQQASAQTGFLHIADSSNTFLHVTELDHPDINDDPDARLIVTPVFNPGGGLNGVNNPNYIGVFYGNSSGRWNIFNEGIVTIPEGAAFNVMIAPPSRSFIHETSSSGTGTTLAHPLVPPLDDVRFFVTHNRNPGGGAQSPALDAPLRSLFFFNPTPVWSIETLGSGVSISSGTEFNVFVPDSAFESIFSHRTGAGNTSGELTRLDQEGLNNNPLALVWVYEWVPFGPSTNNNHPVAVAYDLFNQKWAIINSDAANLANDVRFVVGYLNPARFSDGFETGNTLTWTTSVP